jgi:DNA-binding HxlR family transcriptional regulator
MDSATRNVRTYDHFCLVARSLEKVGDRWSLLVVRDLLSGPRRFTDLMDRLAGITPKTLSQRLRELEDAGIAAVDREPGRREVWYSLTPSGRDLAPVVEALGNWGLRHAWRGPRAGEPLHPEHLLRAAVQAIDTESADRRPTRWDLVIDGETYIVTCDGERWSYSTDADTNPIAVAVAATTDGFTRLILDGSDDGVTLSGPPAATERFLTLIRTIRDVVTTVS